MLWIYRVFGQALRDSQADLRGSEQSPRLLDISCHLFFQRGKGIEFLLLAQATYKSQLHFASIDVLVEIEQIGLDRAAGVRDGGSVPDAAGAAELPAIVKFRPDSVDPIGRH